MLTDEEIKIIYDEYEREIDAGHTVNGFARAIERAVLKKLGEQEPEYYLFAEELYHRESEALSDYVRQEAEKLYAHPLPTQAVPESMPEGWRLTGCGQIKQGDVISMVMAGRRICTSAKEILNAGTNKEEVVYNRKKNHYFITSMVLDGTSNHKDVSIIPAGSLSAAQKP